MARLNFWHMYNGNNVIFYYEFGWRLLKCKIYTCIIICMCAYIICHHWLLVIVKLVGNDPCWRLICYHLVVMTINWVYIIYRLMSNQCIWNLRYCFLKALKLIHLQNIGLSLINYYIQQLHVYNKNICIKYTVFLNNYYHQWIHIWHLYCTSSYIISKVYIIVLYY